MVTWQNKYRIIYTSVGIIIFIFSDGGRVYIKTVVDQWDILLSNSLKASKDTYNYLTILVNYRAKACTFRIIDYSDILE